LSLREDLASQIFIISTVLLLLIILLVLVFRMIRGEIADAP